MKFLFEYDYDKASDFETYMSGKFTWEIKNTYITQVYLKDDKKIRNYMITCSYYLAEWLADSFDNICNEGLLLNFANSEEEYNWESNHNFCSISNGYCWPYIKIYSGNKKTIIIQSFKDIESGNHCNVDFIINKKDSKIIVNKKEFIEDCKNFLKLVSKRIKNFKGSFNTQFSTITKNDALELSKYIDEL